MPILRLPIWIGRENGLERVRQEVSFAIAQSLVAPLLPDADVIVSVTPCLPALAPAKLTAKLHGAAWVVWVQDVVADAAATTGLLPDGPPLRAAKAFETTAFRLADQVLVISNAFRRSLLERGVEDDRIVRIFNPSTRQIAAPYQGFAEEGRPRILSMGNIGHSQGLDRIIEAFEASAELGEMDAELVIAGHGVAADDVRAAATTAAVRFTGVLHGDELEPELRRASIGLVSQRPGIEEFNLPSKMMTYMACGIPVLASVRPESETARIVRESGGGWVTDAAEPAEFAKVAAAKLRDIDALRRAGEAGFRFAEENFSPRVVTDRVERVLYESLRGRSPG